MCMYKILHRHTHTHTHRERETHTERKRKRETDTHTETERERDKCNCITHIYYQDNFSPNYNILPINNIDLPGSLFILTP